MSKENYTTAEASQLLGIKVRTLREWMRTGKIKHHKMGGRRNYISREEILRVSGGKADA